ncbi:unnamed protein product [Auanema sp. JU1783]|nr:unnamed protein product [Auanema sp. JU1783]
MFKSYPDEAYWLPRMKRALCALRVSDGSTNNDELGMHEPVTPLHDASTTSEDVGKAHWTFTTTLINGVLPSYTWNGQEVEQEITISLDFLLKDCSFFISNKDLMKFGLKRDVQQVYVVLARTVDEKKSMEASTEYSELDVRTKNPFIYFDMQTNSWFCNDYCMTVKSEDNALQYMVLLVASFLYPIQTDDDVGW